MYRLGRMAVKEMLFSVRLTVNFAVTYKKYTLWRQVVRYGESEILKSIWSPGCAECGLKSVSNVLRFLRRI